MLGAGSANCHRPRARVFGIGTRGEGSRNGSANVSRDKFLKSLRVVDGLPDPGLPSLEELGALGMEIDDLESAFKKSLQGVGGNWIEAADFASAAEWVKSAAHSLDANAGAPRSLCPELSKHFETP